MGADAVEDAIEGAYKDLPFTGVAQAVFALIYAHKKMGMIPESILELGRADDSSVVRAVLIQNEKAFALYAGKQGFDWQRITSKLRASGRTDFLTILAGHDFRQRAR